MILLESVATNSGFDLDQFCRSWKDLFSNYKGYFDGATKATLKNFADGKGPTESGSASHDLSAAGRIAPLVYRYCTDLPALIASSRSQAAMTHNNPQVIDSAEFFARVLCKVLDGTAPTSAMQAVQQESFKGDPFGQWLKEGLDSRQMPSRRAISEFGQSCGAEAAFPGVVHLIARYESNLKEALVENVMAGGDSAARGMIVGMMLGAHRGMGAIPFEWLSSMKRYQYIGNLLEKLVPEN